MRINKIGRGLQPKILIVVLLAAFVGLVVVLAAVVTSAPRAIPSGAVAQSIAGAAIDMEESWHDKYGAEGVMWGMSDLAHRPGDCHRAGQPYLGITYVPLSEVAARIYSLGTREGVLITAVDANSPAEKAGLLSNDVIVEFGGVPITVNDSLFSLQMKYRSGESVSLTIQRQNDRRQVYVTLTAMDID